MRNVHLWQPTKFELTKGGLRGSRNVREVSVRSRIITDLIGRAYEQAIRRHARGRLLDVGCGNVPLYSVYQPLVDDVVCVDWQHSHHSDGFLDLEVDLNDEIPLPDQCFDTVLATDVLEHLRSPDRFWSESRRLLRVGGKVIVGVPFLYGLHEEPYDYFRYTRHRLTAFCEEHAMKLIELEAYGGPMAVIADLIGKNLPGKWHQPSYQAVASWVLRSSVGRRIDTRHRDRFPLGYCLVAQK